MYEEPVSKTIPTALSPVKLIYNMPKLQRDGFLGILAHMY